MNFRTLGTLATTMIVVCARHAATVRDCDMSMRDGWLNISTACNDLKDFGNTGYNHDLG